MHEKAWRASHTLLPMVPCTPDRVMLSFLISGCLGPVTHGAFSMFFLRAVNLSASQRTKLKDVLKSYFHAKVGPEIRRELFAQQPALLLEQQQRALLALAESQQGAEQIDVD